jgi:hypothetical protein
MHLSEGTDEYRSSFSGGDIHRGIASHWGYKKARKEIEDLFKRYEENIFRWFEETNSIQGLIKTAQQQIEHVDFYNLHSPRPKFVLAYLHAKANDINNALKIFETLDPYQFDNDDELRQKIKANILALAT